MAKRIRLLATSDTHGYIYPYQYTDHSSANQGLARMQALISALRDENTLVIDNGDVLEGSPLDYYHFHCHRDEVSPVTKVMNAMGYDFVNVGNHDFNYGKDILYRHLENLDAPCMTA
ncbi:MAG: metallophosphoesterase, partial [Solobacterium sp.]|nr:metallophosphoesterase [Solobacterium sp.]